MTPASMPLTGPAILAEPIADAVLATIRERGYARASVIEFAERAGISSADFDRRFGDKRAVTTIVFEAHLDEFVDRVGIAYAGVAGWPGNLRAAAYEMSRYLLANPDLAWFMVVGVLEVDEMARARRDEVFSWAAGLIDAGRDLAADPRAVPRVASLVAVGATVESLRRRQAAGREVDFAAELPFLMYAAVRPYLGEEAARIELGIEVPADLRRV